MKRNIHLLKRLFFILSVFATVIGLNAHTASALCAVGASSGCSTDYISNVTFSTISNATTCSGLTTGSTLFSTPNPTLTPGTTYTISVTTYGTVGGDNAYAWIDYNNDGTLDATELVLSGAASGTGSNTFTASVTIPTGATPGATYLRVRCLWYLGAAAIPCGASSPYNYGETEDYLVTIGGGMPAPVVTNNGPLCAGSTLSLSVTSPVAGYTYTWSGPGGYTATGSSVSITGVTTAMSGAYLATGTSGTLITSPGSTTVVINPSPIAPVVTPSVATICNGGTVTLTAASGPASGTILSQDFNSGISPWTTDNTGTTSGAALIPWQIQPSPYTYTALYPTFNSPDLSDYALTNADPGGSGSTTRTKLISPVFSLVGYSAATLIFEHFYRYWNTADFARLQISIDGGATWTLINNYTATTGAPSAFTTASFSLNAYLGNANCMIRFFYGSTWGYFWAVDNVVITGTAATGAAPSWTPVTHLYSDAALALPYVAGTADTQVYVHPTTVSAPTVINYIASVTSAGCSSYDTAKDTINPGVSAITGSSSVCMGTSATLSNATAGGTWTSSNPTVAVVNATTGVVTGVNSGVDTIYYTVTGGCNTFFAITVTNASTPTTGNTVLCGGGFTSTLSNTTAGGSWTTSNAAVALVSATGVVTSAAGGLAVITYTMPSGCSDTTLINVQAPPTPITGLAEVCYSGGATVLSSTPAGGTWTSSDATIAPVDASGVVTGLGAGTATITYAVMPGCQVTKPVLLKANPAAIGGTTSVCAGGSVTTLSNTTGGGTWTITGSSATIDAASGAVTGILMGTGTVTYTTPNGCYSTTSVTINPLPAAITGAMTVCQTNTTLLADATSGGTWTSGATGIATVNAASGLVGGASAGTAPITYALSTGCMAVANVNVNGLPPAITGNDYVCNGFTSALFNTVATGTWSSSNNALATVDASGTIYGVSPGSVTITYTTGTGACYATKPITVSPMAPPTVTIAASPGTTVCAGTTVTFTSALVAGGSAPIYVWSVNNVILSGAVNYTYVPNNGDLVRLWVKSDYTCAIPDTASATIVMTVNPIVTPSVSLTIPGGDTVCVGATANVTANTVAGGPAPTYAWYLNGVPAATGPVYPLAPANGDVVTVTLTSNAPCRTATTATATKIITVSPNVTPVVTLSSMLGTTVCEGYPDVFTATQINGGTAPTYQWSVNGSSMATGAVYSYTPANYDNVQVTLTSNFPCVTSPTATQNVLMTVLPITQPVGLVTAYPGYIAKAGDSVIFTCTILSGGGSSPTYQWYKDNVPMAGATTSVYVTNNLMTGDSVNCQVTNTDQCSGVTVFNSVVMTIGENVGVQGVANNNSHMVLIPNPNNGSFMIKGSLGTGNEDASLEVTNMLGQIIYRSNATAPAGELNELIQLNSNLASGMYLLNIKTATMSNTLHFSLQK